MASPDPGLRGQDSLRSAMRIVGPVTVGVGLLLTAIAMFDFFAAFGGFGMPGNFWMAFIGLPLIGIGAAITKFAYLGPASRYVAGEVTPTIRDTLGALGIGGGASVCPACGGRNAYDAAFCDDCGVPLRQTCSSCGSANAGDAKFCKGCGRELPDPSTPR